MNTYLAPHKTCVRPISSGDHLGRVHGTSILKRLFVGSQGRQGRLWVKAAKIANQAGRPAARTLSDAFCVDRYRDEMSFWI